MGADSRAIVTAAGSAVPMIMGGALLGPPGIICAATVAAVTAVAAWAAERELFDPVDERLTARLMVIEELATDDEPLARARPLVVVNGDGGRQLERFGRVAETDGAAALVVDGSGESIDLPGAQLPIEIHEQLQAQPFEGGAETTELVDVTVEGRSYRVARVAMGEGTLYLGQDVTGLHESLASLRWLLVVAGVVGTGVAALASWFIARRVSSLVAFVITVTN